jgi:hypothetical protein
LTVVGVVVESTLAGHVHVAVAVKVHADDHDDVKVNEDFDW